MKKSEHNQSQCFSSLTPLTNMSSYPSDKIYNSQHQFLQSEKQDKHQVKANKINQQRSPFKYSPKKANYQILQFKNVNQQKTRNAPKFLNGKMKGIKKQESCQQLQQKQAKLMKCPSQQLIKYNNYRSNEKINHAALYQSLALQRKDSVPKLLKNYFSKKQPILSNSQTQKNNPQELFSAKEKLQIFIKHQKNIIFQKDNQIKKLVNELNKYKEESRIKQTKIKDQLQQMYHKQIQECMRAFNQKFDIQNQAIKRVEDQLMKKQKQLNSIITDYSNLLITKSQLKIQITSLTAELLQYKQINKLPNHENEESQAKLSNFQTKKSKTIGQNKDNKNQECQNCKKQLEGYKFIYERLCKLIQSMNIDQIKKQLQRLNEKYKSNEN